MDSASASASMINFRLDRERWHSDECHSPRIIIALDLLLRVNISAQQWSHSVLAGLTAQPQLASPAGTSRPLQASSPWPPAPSPCGWSPAPAAWSAASAQPPALAFFPLRCAASSLLPGSWEEDPSSVIYTHCANQGNRALSIPPLSFNVDVNLVNTCSW